MKWSKQAEEAISRVPFFVRRRVRKRVEEEAVRTSAAEVLIEHVRFCQRRFLDNMESEVRGHQVETCFGPGGCPNRALVDSDLARELEELVAQKGLREFLKTKVQGPLKMHHEFRVSISDCPNACSRPQIADLGIIAAVRPQLSSEECSGCGACVEVCREGAIALTDPGKGPVLDFAQCVACGQCIRVCPTGTIREAASGYRIQVGGKLGRHPQLATELPGIYSKAQVLEIVHRCLEHFKDHNLKGERFGEILNRTGTRFLDSEMVIVPHTPRLAGLNPENQSRETRDTKTRRAVTPAEAGVQSGSRRSPG